MVSGDAFECIKWDGDETWSPWSHGRRSSSRTSVHASVAQFYDAPCKCPHATFRSSSDDEGADGESRSRYEHAISLLLYASQMIRQSLSLALSFHGLLSYRAELSHRGSLGMATWTKPRNLIKMTQLTNRNPRQSSLARTTTNSIFL